MEFTLNRKKKKVLRFKVCVGLKEKMKNGNPLSKKFNQFNVAALVLSFLGTRSYICRIM